jgi:hypothetical protein
VRRRTTVRAVRPKGRAMTEPALPPPDEAAIRTLLQQGQKITAIKAYRMQTRVGLKEAKERVEAIQREMGLPVGPAAGSAGSLGVVALLIVVAFLAWRWLHG